MAVTAEGLDGTHEVGVVVRFPTAMVRRRAAARRRVIAVRRAGAAGAVVVTCILVLLGSGGGTAHASHPNSAPRAVVIRSGQTIWDLAERYAPASSDPRTYVDQVLALNHLSAPPGAGVRVRLP